MRNPVHSDHANLFGRTLKALGSPPLSARYSCASACFHISNGTGLLLGIASVTLTLDLEANVSSRVAGQMDGLMHQWTLNQLIRSRKEHPVRSHIDRRVLPALLAALCLCTSAYGGGFLEQIVSGKASVDLRNKNNFLNIQLKLPQGPPPSVSVITDPEPQYIVRTVDNRGRVREQTNGGPFQYVGNIKPKEYPNGVTYFQLPGQKPVIADPSLWDQQRINQLQQQQIAKQQFEAQEKARAEAHQLLVNMQQNLVNTPFDQVLAEVQSVPDFQLIDAKVRLGILIQYVRSEQLADTTGFERLLVALNDEINRRRAIAQQQPPQQPQQADPQPADGILFAGNLGISYRRLDNGDGTFNAQIVGPPRQNSPAARLGLEEGDVVFELDGMRFDQPQDVLGHRFQTEIGFIDVRSNNEKHYQIYIP